MLESLRRWMSTLEGWIDLYIEVVGFLVISSSVIFFCGGVLITPLVWLVDFVVGSALTKIVWNFGFSVVRFGFYVVAFNLIVIFPIALVCSFFGDGGASGGVGGSIRGGDWGDGGGE